MHVLNLQFSIPIVTITFVNTLQDLSLYIWWDYLLVHKDQPIYNVRVSCVLPSGICEIRTLVITVASGYHFLYIALWSFIFGIIHWTTQYLMLTTYGRTSITPSGHASLPVVSSSTQNRWNFKFYVIAVQGYSIHWYCINLGLMIEVSVHLRRRCFVAKNTLLFFKVYRIYSIGMYHNIS